jgi:Fe-S-cluster containining protein
MAGMSELWYRDGLQFSCKVCGRCCGGGEGFVWVTPEEINRMAKKMGINTALFEQSFVKTVRGTNRQAAHGRSLSLKEYSNGDCVLLNDKTRSCMVYDERPIQCRTWPFWNYNIESPKAWKRTAKYCPGCDNGKLYTLEEIEEQKNGIEL